MTFTTQTGRHRSPRGIRRPRLVHVGATAAAVAGIAAAGVAPASANAGAGGGGSSDSATYSESTYSDSSYDSGRQNSPDRGEWQGNNNGGGSSQAVASSTNYSNASTSAPTESVATNASSSSIIGVAAQYTGIPYVWGGTTTAGFDCSGYTQHVFAQAGISIPRTAAAQQDAATPVSEPAVGDLVFYGAPAWHVGIYAGDGMMYDSATPGTSTAKREVFSGVTGYGRIN